MSVHSILVATDLSSRCDHPLDRGLALAHDWNARLTVLHVLQAARKENRKTAEALAYNRVLTRLPSRKAKVEILIRTGATSETIARTAQDTSAGLIVTGIARIDSVRDFFLGTAVDRIVTHSDVPVLVVKQRSGRPYDNLMIATDLSNCSRAALLGAAEMFRHATLHLVHPYHVPYGAWLKSDAVRKDVQETAQEELDAFLGDPRLSDALRQRLRPFLSCGETAEVVARALHETGANLLVLGIRRRSIANGLTGSAFAALLGSMPCDTLMFRTK